jgi:hypothetical protein
MTSHYEAEGAHPQEGPSGENRYQGMAPEPGGGLALMGDLAVAAVITKARGSLH